MELRRNYTVVGLSPRNTVEIRHHRTGTVSDTGLMPSEFGTWGLEPREIRIVKRGLTAGGRDRKQR